MILHNIGNALTPVGVQIEEMAGNTFKRIQGYLSKSYRDLQQNQSRLTEYVNEDQRGKEVFEFLGNPDPQPKRNRREKRKYHSENSVRF